MTRKLIAAFLIFAMLIPYSSAVAADKEAVTPTVEEILNEYHQKSFEAQQARETGTASANSRSGAGSGKTLEQETVETLTAAGYEAYNVTADNYETLETQLQTDFAAMGLDPNSSYIVVVHGEEPNTPANNARGPGDIVQDPGDLSGGSPYTSYVYKGNTYYLRYVTVTAGDNTELVRRSLYADIEANWPSHLVNNALNAYIVFLVDSINKKVPVGTLVSLFTDTPEEFIYEEFPLDTAIINAYTNWTCNFIQVWNKYDETWDPSQVSEYTTSKIYCTWGEYNPTTNSIDQVTGDPQWFSAYSFYYYETEQRMLHAMKAYDNYTIALDTIPNVSFYWSDATGEVTTNDDDTLIFRHNRTLSLVLPEDSA